jgi:tetratricopeptide (TPR) repeat protein
LEAKAPIAPSTNEGVVFARGQAPEKQPSLDEAERLRQGSSLVRKRLYLEAIEVLEPLFATPPEEWDTWFWMGTAQMGLSHYEEAQEYFREGLARDETIPELWVQWALTEHQRGRYSHALNLLRQAELLAPTLPHIHLNLAFTLERQGNTNSALQHYRKYLSVTDHNRLYLSIRKKVLDRIMHLGRS